MDKKEFLKKMGQLYAQGIQFGYKPEQVAEFAVTTLQAFIQPKKNEFYKKESK